MCACVWQKDKTYVRVRERERASTLLCMHAHMHDLVSPHCLAVAGLGFRV